MKVGNKNSTDISSINSTSERSWKEKKGKSQDLYIFIFQLVCLYNKNMTAIIILSSYRMRSSFCLSYCKGGMSLWNREKFFNDESKAG